MFGATDRTTSSPRPMRSTTPGRKFWMNTSAVPIRRSSASRAAGFFRSSARDRLLRLLLRKEAEKPLRRLLAALRVVAAVGVLDLDHVRALVGEDHRRLRAGDHGGQVDDADAV